MTDWACGWTSAMAHELSRTPGRAAGAGGAGASLSPAAFVFGRGEIHPLFVLPGEIQAQICCFAPDLPAALLLIRRMRLERRARRLEHVAKRVRAHQTALLRDVRACCPHSAVDYEDNGDCHKSGYDRVCRLCWHLL